LISAGGGAVGTVEESEEAETFACDGEDEDDPDEDDGNGDDFESPAAYTAAPTKTTKNKDASPIAKRKPPTISTPRGSADVLRLSETPRALPKPDASSHGDLKGCGFRPHRKSDRSPIKEAQQKNSTKTRRGSLPVHFRTSRVEDGHVLNTLFRT
jgi:hypothetical protein